DEDDRRRATELLTADNPGIASYVVLCRPNRRGWAAELRAAITGELVENCRRRIAARRGYAEAARRWAA
ncbi:hypothetical protein, partial [Zavarzinella formosa]|uniref:hypothetical protein n=1 Tax=Zavarzinella formosa TaxID=360055 RepID=UPI00187DDA1B